MSFPFYPKHDYGCPHVSHCPHAGGAAIGHLVLLAGDHQERYQQLNRQIDSERERCSKLFAENQQLEAKIEQLKLELRLERQHKFATNQQKKTGTSDSDADQSAASKSCRPAGRRGAPIGHPGWFRKTPTLYDVRVDVPAPKACPHCRTATVSAYNSQDSSEHLQEDIIDGQYHVTLFVHRAARCRSCRRWVQTPGKDEILHSRIGPHVRAMAIYLRNEIGVTYRKVPRAIADLLDFHFTPAALLAFEKLLATQAQPLVEDIEKKIASHEGAVHADETYWTLDGQRAYYWVHTTDLLVHFAFETTRAGEVSRNILGDDFAGTLVTDCYSGYHAQTAKAKQKCLAHIARTAGDWQKLVERRTRDWKFFERIKQFVKQACELHRCRDDWSASKLKNAKRFLEQELASLFKLKLSHEKALTLQERLNRHWDEWLTFADDPQVPPTNNLAERSLRPLVIMRKITFGHRSRSGGEQMAALMSVKETARRHGHNPLELFYRLATQPPDRALRFLYGKPSRTA